MEKYITFSVPVKKELENGKTITYKIKFSNTVKFMASSLSIVTDNPSDGLCNSNCKDCKFCLEFLIYKNIYMNIIIYIKYLK